MAGKWKTFLENPAYFITSPAAKGYLNWVPDSLYIKILYKALTGEKCHLKHPITYNEKLQWLKLHDRKPEYAKMVDKYEVRSYIASLFGEEYLIPCYGVYDSFNQIDFDALPKQFVLKCTHDSGSVVICEDKESFDRQAAGEKLTKAMKKNYYDTYREWPYKDVKPRIIVEKYMVDESGDDLKDYKILCFNGRAKIIETHENRYTKGKVHTQTFYTQNWEKLDIYQVDLYPTKTPREKPAQMDTLISMSEKIAKDMYHVRVDWYLINGNIYFGEITFYDGSGFEPFPAKKDNLYLGNLMELPQ